MITGRRAAILTVGLLFFASAEAGSSALEGFEPFIGGEWRLGNSVQVFEWGPGRTSVIARGYREDDGQRKLVSHGIWYWHPEQKMVLGKATATEMPITLFEFKTRFDENLVIHDLSTYSAKGDPGVYVETWELKEPNVYEWKLLLPRPDSTEVVMSGIFVRDESN